MTRVSTHTALTLQQVRSHKPHVNRHATCNELLHTWAASMLAYSAAETVVAVNAVTCAVLTCVLLEWGLGKGGGGGGGATGACVCISIIV